MEEKKEAMFFATCDDNHFLSVPCQKSQVGQEIQGPKLVSSSQPYGIPIGILKEGMLPDVILSSGECNGRTKSFILCQLLHDPTRLPPKRQKGFPFFRCDRHARLSVKHAFLRPFLPTHAHVRPRGGSRLTFHE